MSLLKIADWGLIDYEQALQQQEELVQQVSKNNLPGFLVFCSHPSIVTLGRKTQADDVFAWDGPIKEISRGGRATYHGPSQLVVYPIVNLQMPGATRPAKDIGALLRLSEEAIVETLSQYGIQASGKSLQKMQTDQTGSEETGVWIGQQKIASLGIAIRQWVSFHGMAINLDEDPQAFKGMRPCGFSSEVMISLERLTSQKTDRQKFSELLKNSLLKRL